MITQIRKIKKTKIDRESTIRTLNTQLRKIKVDLLNIENTNYKSNSYYHKWINEQKKLVIPVKDKFMKHKSIDEDDLYQD